MNVDIIIPIYNAFEDLLKCIESIYKYTDLVQNRLILINDASSDERVGRFLDQQVNLNKNIIVLHNQSNQGFSANINTGMKQSSTNDVILLNSDTIVTSCWVEKIVRCAYSDEAIGTVTPVSNNATLCSVPDFCQENTLPDYLNISKAAEIVEKYSFNEYPRITVAHGFCMFIKRVVINAIGYFDAETFGRGYGEENDYCNRAEQAGYKHVMCDNTYIYHGGTKSFLSKDKENFIREHEKILNERYPVQMHNNAVYCRDNPNQSIGDNVKIYFTLKNGKKNILYLAQADFRAQASDNIGGVQLHISHLVESMRKQYNVFVVARDGSNVAVTAYTDEQEFLFLFPIPKQESYLLISDCQMRYLWETILTVFEIDLIHVQHVIGTSFDVFNVAEKMQIPLILTLHDFYFACPMVKLLDHNSKTCVGCDDLQKCKSCMAKQMKIVPAVDYIGLWRERCGNYMKKARIIIAPSQSAKDIIGQYYPQVLNNISVIEHGYDQECMNWQENIKTSLTIKSNVEKLEKRGGGYRIIGWAYDQESDCRENEIWLRIKNEYAQAAMIPTQAQNRLDVSRKIDKADCGFIGYVPIRLCQGRMLEIEIIIKTPTSALKEIQKKYTVQLPSPLLPRKLNVAFIGGLNEAKGGIQAAEIIKKTSSDISWFVFGGIGVKELEALERDNLIKSGYYKNKQLSALLKEHEIDVICLLSLWPETYSYTLSEAVINKIPVIATDIGALGYRTKFHNYGWTVDVNSIVKDTLGILSNVLKNKADLQEKKEALKGANIKSLEQMIQEYKVIYEQSFQKNIPPSPYSIDTEYIYKAYQYANKDFSTFEQAEINTVNETLNELATLKSSLTYKAILKIQSLKLPFKTKIKRLLTKHMR